ncbi:hypothetical protein [Sphingomonas sp.]|uniref:hypothetical protein n=1 Tax=Sphingomonas sp. TaxID=28214 RepID=UPI00307CFC0D
MTKLRRPMTPYRALSRIADVLGWDGCADVVEKSEWTVRKLSDPDTGRNISLQDAIRLDRAYRRAGGVGAPLFEAYAAAIEFDDADPDMRRAELVQASGVAVKEAGEAIAAALSSIDSSDSSAARMKAILEVEEGLQAFQSLLISLRGGGL